MDEPGFFAPPFRGRKIVIWGLGLMGGSLAMALRGSGAEVVGIDRSEAVVATALQRGIVTQAATDPQRMLTGADLVVLAVPIRAILMILERLPALCPAGPVVIDLGSTKRKITQAMDALPARFPSVGGHPMCGKEISGLDAADAEIYSGATFAFVETQRTTAEARQLAEMLAAACGAQPLWLTADQHDRWVAATSQAPLLIASALTGATLPEAAPLVGPGFRSSTRLARGGQGPANPMIMDMLATNTDNILNALNETKHALDEIIGLLQGNQFIEISAQLARNAERLQQLTGAPRAPERN